MMVLPRPRWLGRGNGDVAARAGSRGEIVALQALRGVAASGVVAEHLLQRLLQRGAVPGELPAFAARLGESGVAVFFAISGFIMVHTTFRGTSRPTPAAFLRSRYLRVAPLYYLATLAMVAFGWATRAFSTQAAERLPTFGELLLSFLFIPHRGANGVIQPVYELGWTLQYEMFFYLLFAAGLAFPRWRGCWLVLLAILALVAVGPLIGAPAARFGPAVLGYVFTRPILLFFAVGVTIGVLRSRWEGRLPRVPASMVALLVPTALAAAAVVPGQVGMVLAVAIALSATVLVTVRPAASAAGRSCAAVARAFGDGSYSIYLTHSFLLGAFAALTAPFAGRGLVAFTATLLAACVMCAIAGWATWRLVELPIDRRVRRRRLSAR